jgi:hypothetical protein
MMRQKDFANAFDGECRSSSKNTKGNDSSREWLRFAMTIRMTGIGRSRRISQPAPDYDRARRVECRFDSISDESVGIPENADGDLDER